MSRRTLLAFVVLPIFSGCFRVRPESLLPAGGAPSAAQVSEYLDGRASSFIVLGDSSSFVWPALLQDLLSTHAQVGGVYRVRNAAAADARVSAWSAETEAAFRSRLASVIAAEARASVGAPLPKFVLCQVSLRGVGDSRGPVKSEHDMVGAEMGADALERLARELRQLGVERIVFATPPHETGADPELGLERVAIERLLARGHEFIAAGPDLNAATRRYFPDAYDEDRVQLNEFGLKLVAEEWYRYLAGPEAREDVVEALYAQPYDVKAIEAAQLERSGFRP